MSAVSAQTEDGDRPATESTLGETLDPLDAARFFDLSVDMLCVAGVDGYFKSVNPSWSRTLGFSNDELLSRPYMDFVHPGDREATAAEAAKVAGGFFRTVHFRNRYRCKDGSYRWLEWSATPASSDGSIYAIARDVTATVTAEEERELNYGRQRERVQAALADGAIYPVFQPIIDLRTHASYGWEALSRFAVKPLRSPDQWFADAQAVGLVAQLELRAISEVVALGARLPAPGLLFLNASPETLVTPAFADLLADLNPSNLVVEVTEHAAVEDYEQLQWAIDSLRRKGVRLAIDDAGAGAGSLKHVVRLLPEFIKLDLFLTRDIDDDPAKRALAAALIGFARQIGARMIAEGVETADELSVLEELGIEHAQGYYLGEPIPVRPAVS